MIINHNLNAINAHRNMIKNIKSAGKSMAKLSSGLRINSACDDAAGLAISEKMRAQINGLNMEVRNAQDGISLIQTAEGALNETHSILQRMRELSIEAGNDTNTKEDRNQIQKEMNQLTSEINRIGNTTEFNTKKILDKGPGVSLETKLKFIKEMKSGWLESSEKLIESTYGITGKNSLNSGDVFVDFYYNTGKNGKCVKGEVSEGKLVLNVDLNNFYSDDLDDIERGRLIAKEFTKAVLIDTLHNEATVDAPEAFINGLADLVVGEDSIVKDIVKDETSPDGYSKDEANKLAKHAVVLLEGTKEWGSEEMYKYDEAAAYVILQSIAQNTKATHHNLGELEDIFHITISQQSSIKTTVKSNMENFMKDFNDLDTIREKRGRNDIGFIDSLEYAVIKNTKYISLKQMSLAMKGDIASWLQVEGIECDLSYFILDEGQYSADAATSSVGGVDTRKLGMQINWKSDSEVDEGAYIGSNFGNSDVKREDIVAKASFKKDPLSNYKTEFANPYDNPYNLKLEVGGSVSIQLTDMRARALNLEGKEGRKIDLGNGKFACFTTFDGQNGVTDGTNSKITGHALDITSHEKAEGAIFVIDKAINKVSNQRSYLGATQNRLEHTINNLQSAAENLQAAESRIRDADMASEMMNFSKNNILGQAAQAMLAQANQMPQGILQLLR